MAGANGKSNLKFAEMKSMQLDGWKGKILNWSDMMQAPKEAEWIIKDLITAGSVVTIYGGGGSKKTYSVIDLAMCVQMKSEWLGFGIPKPVPVLFVDEESGKNRLSLRYMEAKNGYNVKNNLPIYTVCMARYSLREQKDIDELRKMILFTGAKLIIIDSLVTVLNGDENSSKEIAQLYANLKTIADQTNSAILVIHHSNKVEGYRGSTAIRDQSDLLIHVSSKNASPNIDYETEKERDIEHVKWSAVSYLEKGKKFYLVSSRKNKLSRLGKAQEHVIAYLYEFKQATMEDMKEHNGECSPSAIRNAAYKLLEDKFISNDEWQGKSRLFCLSELGENYAMQYMSSGLESVIASL